MTDLKEELLGTQPFSTSEPKQADDSLAFCDQSTGHSLAAHQAQN